MNYTKRNISSLVILSFVLASVISCNLDSKPKLVNDKHLNHLYEEIVADGNDMAIIHIYAEYPSYDWVDDSDEGTSCVDDVARAVVFYVKDYAYNGNDQSRIRAQKLIKFILHMQSGNGYFYNFIFSDTRINKDHPNSVNNPNWWSWRALWALTEAYPVLKDLNTELSEKILIAMKKVVENIKSEFLQVQGTRIIEGIKFPRWLPYEYAADQASILMIGLSNYQSIIADKSVEEIINHFANGIIMMQVNNPKFEFHGVFLSWQNNWHGWGNLQSYALLKAYNIYKNQRYLESALLEIDHFYNELFNRKYLNQFSISSDNGNFKLNKVEHYSQIAYSFRPMVYAALEAFKITGDKKYIKYATSYSKWFFGDNHQNQKIYFPETGICYDGLNETKVNKNSGAESTLEALLLFQEIEQNDIPQFHLNDTSE